VYTHLFAWLVVAAIYLHALVLHRERRALWLTMSASAVLVALFLPWTHLLLTESQADLGSMRPLAQEVGLAPIKLLTAPAFLLFGSSFTPLHSGAILFVTISGALVLILETRKVLREGTGREVLLPWLVVACEIGVPVLIYYARPLFLPERTLAAGSPFLIVLLTWGVKRRGSPLPILVALAAAIMVWGTVLHLMGGQIKPPYREAMWLVAQNHQRGDVVVHTSDGSYLPALCYVNLPRHVVLAGDPDPRKPESVYRLLGGEVWTPEQVVQSGERVWLIVALEHSLDWQKLRVAWFDDRCADVERYGVDGVGVYLYSCDLG